MKDLILALVAPLLAVAMASTASIASTAQANLLGPLGGTGLRQEYSRFADSPFTGLRFSYFYLEDFEDHLFNSPGVRASSGGVTSKVFGPTIHDSVDLDDGILDGSGLAGDSFWSGSNVIKFTFDARRLGGLPTHVGIVWTDGAGPTTFQAFDANGNSLGTVGPVNIADSSQLGETAEDRFFGVVDRGGISAIQIGNTAQGLEVDHLQYWLGVDPLIPPTLTATNTPRPTATVAPRPTATDTPQPPPTATSTPTSTDTSTPTLTWTATPTSSSTPSPTLAPSRTPSVVPSATPAPCVPLTRASDIVLVLDRSSSMNSAGKLTAAIQAITQFVDAAKSPPDQLALVAFADVAGLMQPLTTDKASMKRVLGTVITGAGTRIDLGLKVARQELIGTRHRPDHGLVLILLSDGVQAPGEYALVMPEADAAKSAGAVIFTIALGAGADVALLSRVASSASHAYVAPTAAELDAIYGRIAVAIPCPPTATAAPATPAPTATERPTATQERPSVTPSPPTSMATMTAVIPPVQATATVQPPGAVYLPRLVRGNGQ